MKNLFFWPILFMAFYLVHFENAKATTACGRIAVINYQDVMVDSNTTGKAEGLRIYLEKDPDAKKLLDQYQSSLSHQWLHATISTTGAALILAGSFIPKEHPRRDAMLYSGIGMVLLNFLVAKAKQQQAERYLQRAIEQYNKRNLPQINFEVSVLNLAPQNFNTRATGLYVQLTKDF